MEFSDKEKTKLVSQDIVSFFDLLAKFDYEDKQKEKSVVGAGSLGEISKGSVSETENKLGSDPCCQDIR